jgi:two-component system, LytTR family, sensor kinase
MQTALPPVSFDDRLMRLIGIPLVGFLIPLAFMNYSPDMGLAVYWPVWVSAMAHTAVCWEGNRLIYIWVRRRFPALSQTTRRLLWLTGFSLLFTVLFSAFACYGLNEVLTWLLPATARPRPTLLQEYRSSLIPTIVCLAIYECVFYFKQLRVALLEAEQLKRANLQSQLETLKNQVNPHFLFNSLNALTALIPEDPELAVRFVQKLAKVYRYILEIRELQTVSLADELSALRAYNFLLQIRFGNNLHIGLDLPANRLADRVVPLSLQMLVENAVKHNIVSTHKPLHIRVFVENERIIVQNNLQRRGRFDADPVPDSTGLGLQNITNRYRLLANQPVDVIVTTQQFAVSLPLISEKITERQREENAVVSRSFTHSLFRL